MPLSLSGCGYDIDEGPRNEVPYQSPQVYIGPNTRPALTSDRIIFFVQFYNIGYLCIALRAPESLIIESSDDSLSRFARRLEVIMVSVAQPHRASLALSRDISLNRGLNRPVLMTNFIRSPLPRR